MKRTTFCFSWETPMDTLVSTSLQRLGPMPVRLKMGLEQNFTTGCCTIAYVLPALLSTPTLAHVPPLFALLMGNTAPGLTTLQCQAISIMIVFKPGLRNKLTFVEFEKITLQSLVAFSSRRILRHSQGDGHLHHELIGRS